MGKRETQRWLKLIQRVPLIKKPELLNDILEETEELIKIFVTSIKTAVRQAHGPERSRRAENKQK
jgi:four helix bundle protein